MRFRQIVLPIFSALLLPIFSLAQKEGKIRIENPVIESEGWQLHGHFICAANKSTSPIVVMFNKANGSKEVYFPLQDKLAALGISSLSIDLRGHGASINKGRFIPFKQEHNDSLQIFDEHRDIANVYDFLLRTKKVDVKKLFFVGASYSGDEVVRFLSMRGVSLSSVILLSPGSLSDESIGTLGKMQIPWLLLKSFEERSMQQIEKRIFEKSAQATIITVPGKVHATDILATYPGIEELIVGWVQGKPGNLTASGSPK